MGCCQGRTSIEAAKDVKAGEMKGKVAIITGPTAGIGLITATVLAGKGAHIILAGRSAPRMADAEKAIRRSVPDAVLTSIVLDLGSFKSVRTFAAEFLKLNLPLNYLINNAGIMAAPYSKTEDGFEVQYQTNHLSHFLLTALLLPKLKESAPSRIICLSSIAVERALVTVAKPDFNLDEKTHTPFGAYGNSKLANALHAWELARRLQGTGVTAYSVHPGVFPSELSRQSCLVQCYYCIGQCCMKSVDQGAATSLYVTCTPGIEKYSGQYWNDCEVDNAVRNPLWNHPGLALELWNQSEKATQSGPVLAESAGAPQPMGGGAGVAKPTTGSSGADEKAPLVTKQ